MHKRDIDQPTKARVKNSSNSNYPSKIQNFGEPDRPALFQTNDLYDLKKAIIEAG